MNFRAITVKLFLLVTTFTSSFGLFTNVSLSTIFNENKPLVGFALTTLGKILNPTAASTTQRPAGFTSKLTKLLASLLNIPPEVYFSTHQHILQQGYPAEEHFVVTPDGYILTVNRIPGPRHSRGRSRSPDVVLMMTATLSSSSDYIVSSPNHSLAYLLADAGYDVWLGNVRGTRDGRNHTRLNPDKDRRFWNFSIDDVARYDYPALASYITRHAGVERFFFVGFSAANRCLFMSASAPNSFIDKIRLSVSLAPALGTEQSSPFMSFFSKIFSGIRGAVEKFNGGQFYHGNDFMMSLIYIACSDRSKLRPICLRLIATIMGGMHSGYDGKDKLAFAMNSVLSGTSNKAAQHQAQINTSPVLRMFNYGAGNMAAYGSEKPPAYNLSLVSAPVALFVSPDDRLMPIGGLESLKKSLTNVVVTHFIKQPDYGHMDLIFSDSAKELVYDHVLPLMKLF
ncbi:lipase member K [Hyalella azteca]|uniref:Lipase member K n=1 Tax=Hyalella azteca TaxID=294128 RepID=A0A8B7NBM1_HYAAZ|nr:lipase member K [Hyalella azteca]